MHGRMAAMIWLTYMVNGNDEGLRRRLKRITLWLPGYDSYPAGFDCSHPYTLASDAVSATEYFWGAHLEVTK
jgi:hypothetical protein